MNMEQLKERIAAMEAKAHYTYSAAELARETAACLEAMRKIVAGEAVETEQTAG